MPGPAERKHALPALHPWSSICNQRWLCSNSRCLANTLREGAAEGVSDTV